MNVESLRLGGNVDEDDTAAPVPVPSVAVLDAFDDEYGELVYATAYSVPDGWNTSSPHAGTLVAGGCD